MLLFLFDDDDVAIVCIKGGVRGDAYSLEDGKGFYLMTGAWFSEYMYQIAVKKSSLSAELKALVDTDDVTVLPAWDPMGALARTDLI